MNEVAKAFLARCFAPGSTIALLLRTETPARTLQRVVALQQTLAPRYLGWLAHQNHHKANIYVAANPLRPGSRRRTKENVELVRHLYLDIDQAGDARLAALRASDAVPAPTVILSTSPGKYQVLWRVDGFDFNTQETTLKRLAVAFGGDPACTDCNRVIRVPGFLNWKYSPAHRVTVDYVSDAISGPSDFRLPDTHPHMTSQTPESVLPNPRRRNSQSEADWAWACHQLQLGEDADKLTRELAARRSNKPHPLYYAQRTIDIASARFWLIDGVAIDDVISMLEARRRLQLNTQLCSVRAREIANTAQRMVARPKSA